MIVDFLEEHLIIWGLTQLFGHFGEFGIYVVGGSPYETDECLGYDHTIPGGVSSIAGGSKRVGFGISFEENIE